MNEIDVETTQQQQQNKYVMKKAQTTNKQQQHKSSKHCKIHTKDVLPSSVLPLLS